MFYVSLSVTTKQKPTIDTVRYRERNQSIPLKKIIKTKEESKRVRTKKGTTKRPLKMNKMAIVTHYLPIITLNVKELNSQVKRHRVAEWIK